MKQQVHLKMQDKAKPEVMQWISRKQPGTFPPQLVPSAPDQHLKFNMLRNEQVEQYVKVMRKLPVKLPLLTKISVVYRNVGDFYSKKLWVLGQEQPKRLHRSRVREVSFFGSQYPALYIVSP